MTKKEFYTAVIEANINSEISNFAKLEIDKLDRAAEHRKNTPTKKQRENTELKSMIFDCFVGDNVSPMTGADVAEMMSITPQKANALLKQLVDEGKLKVTEVAHNKRLINSFSINN